jgi:folate-binding protein YgfZ
VAEYSSTHDPAGEYRAARQTAALFDLAGRGLVELAGKDAVTFLHNLSTNDIKALAEGAGCESFLTTNKARVVAQVFVSRLHRDGGDVLWLDVAPGQAETLVKHLDHYLISEEVELTDRSAEIAQLHLCGPQAGEVLSQSLAEPLPDLRELALAPATVAGAEVYVRRHDALGLPGHDLFCPRDRAGEMRQRLTDAGAVPAGPEAYEMLRVEAGLPAFGADMDENRLVMEVGRTRQAICYTKGCFLGQEPIVMARDRGHVNRTLLGLMILEGGPAPRGARVLQGGDEVGQVTSSVRSPRLGPIALAYLRRGSQQPGTRVEVEAEDGRRAAEVTTLPFPGGS